MNPLYGNTIPCSAILECVPEGIVERSLYVPYPVQNQVELRSWRTQIPSLPMFQTVAPTTPKLGGARGDFEQMVTDEEEVVRSLLQPTKSRLEDVILVENVPKYLR